MIAASSSTFKSNSTLSSVSGETAQGQHMVTELMGAGDLGVDREFHLYTYNLHSNELKRLNHPSGTYDFYGPIWSNRWGPRQ